MVLYNKINQCWKKQQSILQFLGTLQCKLKRKEKLLEDSSDSAPLLLSSNFIGTNIGSPWKKKKKTLKNNKKKNHRQNRTCWLKDDGKKNVSHHLKSVFLCLKLKYTSIISTAI